MSYAKKRDRQLKREAQRVADREVRPTPTIALLVTDDVACVDCGYVRCCCWRLREVADHIMRGSS